MNIHSITLFGFGNMGQALFDALAKQMPAINLCVVEKNKKKRELARSHFSSRKHTSIAADALCKSDITNTLIIVAVKPQDCLSVLHLLHEIPKPLMLVSLMAGVPLHFLKKFLPQAQLARIMPSLAASIGKAVSGLSFDDHTDSTFHEQVKNIARCMGSFIEIPESLMPAITAMSGSALAFVFRFIDALSLAAIREGIDSTKALPAVLEVVEAATLLCKMEQIHPATFAEKVSSPGGTTIEGLSVLDEGGFVDLIGKAIHATAHKARQMEHVYMENPKV